LIFILFTLYLFASSNLNPGFALSSNPDKFELPFGDMSLPILPSVLVCVLEANVYLENLPIWLSEKSCHILN
jgi:hypothetical protein